MSGKTDQDLSKRVNDIVASYMSSKANVGLIVGVVCGGQRHVFGFGKVARDVEQVPDGDTLWEIGSITKVFTSNLLADMVARGLVRLDDPAQKYLPPSVRMPTRDGKEITLLHLATHTSGLPRLPSNLSETVKDEENPYANYQVDDLYRFLSGYRLKRNIGLKYEYSNLGAGLLGHVLGLAAGRSYEELVAERVCEPLGLKVTRIILSPEQAGRLAQGHSEKGKPVSLWDMPSLAGAGALRSSVGDMLTYLDANLGAAQGALKVVLEMCQVQQASRAPHHSTAWRYAAAVLLTGLSVLLQLLFGPPRRGSPIDLALFAVPVWLSARYGGWKPGLVTTLLYSLALRYFWLPPVHSLAMNTSRVAKELGAHLIVGSALSWLGDRGHRAAEQEKIALAWHMDPLGKSGTRMLWHNGGTGGFCSFMGFVRETSTGVVVLSNSANSVDDLGIALLKSMNDRQKEAEAEPESPR